jgi:hypothetical protein
MRDHDSRLQMIEIAEGYERMAQRAREKERDDDPAGLAAALAASGIRYSSRKNH